MNDIKVALISTETSVKIGGKTADQTHIVGYDLNYGVFSQDYITATRLSLNNSTVSPVIAGTDLLAGDTDGALDRARQSSGGTGLGLSIAKKNMEKHNATLELTGNEKDTTVFIIRFEYDKKKCNS